MMSVSFFLLAKICSFSLWCLFLLLPAKKEPFLWKFFFFYFKFTSDSNYLFSIKPENCERKTSSTNFEPNLKHALIKYCPGWLALGRTILGFPGNGNEPHCDEAYKGTPIRPPYFRSGPVRGKYMFWYISCIYTSCLQPIRGNIHPDIFSAHNSHPHVIRTSGSDGSKKQRTNRSLFLTVLNH